VSRVLAQLGLISFPRMTRFTRINSASQPGQTQLHPLHMEIRRGATPEPVLGDHRFYLLKLFYDFFGYQARDPRIFCDGAAFEVRMSIHGREVVKSSDCVPQ
jgi:hypothetical protein